MEEQLELELSSKVNIDIVILTNVFGNAFLRSRALQAVQAGTHQDIDVKAKEILRVLGNIDKDLKQIEELKKKIRDYYDR